MRIIGPGIALSAFVIPIAAVGFHIPSSAAPADGRTQAARAAVTLSDAFAADRAFAAAAKDGPTAAFRAFYAPDGQFLTQGTVTRGNRAVSSGFRDFKLAWQPDGGHDAASGDLAVTTGRYSIRSGGELIETGRYLTVWRRTADAGWKVVVGSKDVDAAMMARSAEAASRRP